jgi:transposase
MDSSTFPQPPHSAHSAHVTSRGRRWPLAEKLRIVKEASQAGVKLVHIERKYGLGKNVLAYWRKVYRDLPEVHTAAHTGSDEELAALRWQVQALERLLGQKTLELELLKARLEPSCARG